MKILLNGEQVETHSASLNDILVEFGYGDGKVATALNEEFIPATMRANVSLNDHDRLEILAPMQGG